jgi:hypothetical protein
MNHYGSQTLMHAGLYLRDMYPEMALAVPAQGASFQRWKDLREAFNIIDACVTLCQATEVFPRRGVRT